MKLDEHDQLKTTSYIFNIKTLTSIPFGGPIGMFGLRNCSSTPTFETNLLGIVVWPGEQCLRVHQRLKKGSVP